MRTLLKILLCWFSVLNLTQCAPLTQAQMALNRGSTLKRGSQMIGVSQIPPAEPCFLAVCKWQP